MLKFPFNRVADQEAQTHMFSCGIYEILNDYWLKLVHGFCFVTFVGQFFLHYYTIDIAIIRSSRLVVFCKKGILTKFAKFTRKHLRQGLVFNEAADLEFNFNEKKRFWHRCFIVNFARFLITTLLKKPLDGCFCRNPFRLFKNDVTHIFLLSIFSD